MKAAQAHRNTVDLVVLDMVGTTVEDTFDVQEVFVATFASFGLPLDAGALQAVRGASKRSAIESLLKAEPHTGIDAATVFHSFNSNLRSALEQARLCPARGAEALLRRLREHEIRIALNTGLEAESAHVLVRRLNWSNLVDAVVTADDVPQGRPAPYMIFLSLQRTGVYDLARVAAVGDTRLDLEAGHNARVGFNVGMIGGAHSREMLESAPHTHILDSFDHLSGTLGLQPGS